MSTPIGTVKNLKGVFFATDETGRTIELKIGDVITDKMLVFGADENAPSAVILVELASGESVTITGTQTQFFDSTLVAGANDFEGGVALENVQSALGDGEAQGMELAMLDETAGGEEAAREEGDGSVFMAQRDGTMVDVSTGLRSAGFNAGAARDDEEHRQESEVSMVALERAGSMTDVNSGLRDSGFTFPQSHDYRIDTTGENQSIERIATDLYRDPFPTSPDVSIPDTIPATPAARIDFPVTPVVNEPAPVPVTVSIGDATEDEGGTLVFDVSLSNPSATSIGVSFSLVDGSTEGESVDYANMVVSYVDAGNVSHELIPSGGVYTIPAGITALQVSVDALDDSSYEGDETFTPIRT